MSRRLSWPLAIALATIVSLAAILAIVWYEMGQGGWTVNLLSPALLIPLAALLAFMHIVSSALALVIERTTRLSPLLVLPFVSGLTLFLYLSWVIVTVNPAGRTYAQALAYSAEDIALIALAGVVGGVTAATVLVRLRPAEGLSSSSPELSTRCRCRQGCD